MDPDASDVLRGQEMDRMLRVLSKRQRRLILLTLRRMDRVTETDVMVRGSRDPNDADIQLEHNHLPKLAEAGYVEWDRETGEIVRGPRFEEIQPLLELIENHADELPPDWP